MKEREIRKKRNGSKTIKEMEEKKQASAKNEGKKKWQ